MLELVDLVKHYQVGGEEVIRAVDGVSMSVAAGRSSPSMGRAAQARQR